MVLLLHLLVLLQRNLKLEASNRMKDLRFVVLGCRCRGVLLVFFCSGLPNAAPQSQSQLAATATLIKTNGKNKQEAAKTKSKLIKRIAAQKFRLTYAENCCFSCGTMATKMLKTLTKMKSKRKKRGYCFSSAAASVSTSAAVADCYCFSCCTEKPSLLLSCCCCCFLAI